MAAFWFYRKQNASVFTKRRTKPDSSFRSWYHRQTPDLRNIRDESQKEVDNQSGLEVFNGFTSTISNILFSDIQVVVETSSTIWEDIVDWVNHLFYGKTFGLTDTAKDPCETNHLGIIAGHVEYAKMSALSVYYSDDTKVAINLNDAGQKANGEPLNYASSTGFVGFMYNLNPVVNTDGSITVGSGLDSADISYQKNLL